jgi:hypothetical protein
LPHLHNATQRRIATSQYIRVDEIFAYPKQMRAGAEALRPHRKSVDPASQAGARIS